ncbi:MAG: TonB-dependent receptor [Ponticaulis sp.]|nr:TonB-dependent receptor [Ponticaulis sp.]|tara:strand:+ start:18592 stop:21141 length:2550 start_codon:yes stop_codon:yes gene_type:complete
MTTFGQNLALSASILALGTLSAPAVYAQDDETGADSSRRMQTVTVTSGKREQTLQDIPVAVSVVDSETIEKAEILDLLDLQSVVPSLRIDQYQSAAQTAFNIRGFGNGDNNAGVEPSVGVFIDGVYRSRSAAQIADLPNLQRVEVLRGPQSTLFGKNASAGVISIVTEEPQFETQGSVEASVGNFGLLRGAADITGPLSDTVAYSLSGHINTRDGFATELNSGEDLNDRNRWGARGQLLFTPNEDLKIRLIADYDKVDEACCYATNVRNGPTGAVVLALGGQINGDDPFARNVYYNFVPSSEVENYGVSGQVDYDFDFATLTSITAWRNSNFSQNLDGDFNGADLLQSNFTATDIDTFTQEIRLTTEGGEIADWMAGVYFFDEQIDISNDLKLGSDYRGFAEVLSGGGIGQVEGLLGVPMGTFGQAGVGYDEAFTEDNQAWSVFGTVDAYITDRLTATIGLNYTHDEKSATGNIINTDAFSALDFVVIGNNVLYQTAFAQTLAGFGIDATDPTQVSAFAMANPAGFAMVQAGSQAFADANDSNPAVNPLLGLRALQFLPPFVNFPNSVEPNSTEDEALTYSFRLAFDASENINVYASVATGFKASSWNLSRDSRPVAGDIPRLFSAGLGVPNLTSGTRFVGPEDSRVLEAGLKASFDTWSVNLAVFDQEIKGFQSNIFTGTGLALTNAGIQSTTGIEIEANWSPIEGLNLFYAGLHMEPVFDEYTNSPSGDLTGVRPQSIAENYVSVGGTYDWTLSNGWDAYVRADYQYESEAYLSYDFTDTDQTKQIDVVNASAGVETDGGLRLSVWGRNIFDDEYLIESFPSVAQEGSITGYPSNPATYGITVAKDF